MKKIAEKFAGLFLVLGVALTYWGLSHRPWPSVLPWSNTGALTRYLIFFGICAGLVIAGSFWSRRSALLIGFALAAGIALLSGNLWPLFVALWLVVASVLLGRSILTALRIMLDDDSWLISFLVGVGIYGTAVGLLAHFPVNYPGLYGIALALPIILSRRTILEGGKRILSRATQNHTPPVTFKINILDVAIAVVSLVYFVVALMPELGYDALAMHLFVPVQLATRHQWGFDVTKYVWAVFPMLGDWIFSIGYMLAGETGARLINVVFIFTLAGLVRELVLWAGGSILGARWATLIFLSTPLTFAEGSTLYIDPVWASFVVAGTWKIFSSCSGYSKPKFEFPMAGLLLGFALAAKAVTFSILPILFLIMILRYRSWYKSVSLHSSVLGFSLFFVFSLIPYITAWSLTNNPVFPFFNAVFKSPYYFSTSNFDTTAVVYGQGITWDILYRWTFKTGKYLEATVGASGFQWLLLFLPTGLILFAKRQYRGMALFLVAALIVVSVFHSVSYLRYVFPAWVMFSAAIGAALSIKFSKYSIMRYLWYISAIITILLNLLFLEAGAFYRDFPLGSITDENNRMHYLVDNMPIRYAVKLINDLNIDGSPVAVFAEARTAGLASDAFYPAWYNWSFQKEIISIQTEKDAAEILFRRGVKFVILDSNWLGTNCCPDGGMRQKLIANITEPIAQYHSIGVRKIKIFNARFELHGGTSVGERESRPKGVEQNEEGEGESTFFKTELLTNPNFASANAWNLPMAANYDLKNGIISASVDSPATQYVGVTSGRYYLYTIVARSAKEGIQGRMQINWLNKRGKFITTDIQVYNCSSTWTKHTMKVIAPPNVSTAVVYVGGHSSIPVEFKSCSLRE